MYKEKDVQELTIRIDRHLEIIRLKRKSIRDSMRGHTIPPYDIHNEEKYADALRKSEYASSNLSELAIEEKTLLWVKEQIKAIGQNDNSTFKKADSLFKSGMTDIEFMAAVAIAICSLHSDGVVITQAAVINHLGCAKQTFQKRFRGNNFTDYVQSVLDDKGYVTLSIKKKGD